jgi:hypothetical protein
MRLSPSAPIEGFLHRTNELDTLGDDEPESPCHLNKYVIANSRSNPRCGTGLPQPVIGPATSPHAPHFHILRALRAVTMREMRNSCSSAAGCSPRWCGR